jgi:putative ABC transport system substrate-binding protein
LAACGARTTTAESCAHRISVAASAPDANIESVRQLNIGYVEGRDFIIEARYAERDYDKFSALIEELLRATVDLIVTGGPATEAAPLASLSVSVV